MVRHESPDRVLAADHQQSRHPDPVDSFSTFPATLAEAECANDLGIGEIEERRVRAPAIERDRTADTLDLQRIEILPPRLWNDQRRVVERAARRFPTLNLVHEERHADGPPVRVRPATTVHAITRG